MEAVGVAASIGGLVGLGLSLAKALNSYVGSILDSNDDIVAIADDIYATYRHLNDLDWVIKQNQKTKVLTLDALPNAERCIKQADLLVQKLKKLLMKGGGNTATTDIEPDQIDVNKFRRGIWYIYKSEFELRRTELHHIKADISMVYLTYLAMSADSTSARKQAKDEMELVYNKKVALGKDLKKARRNRDRQARETSGRYPSEGDDSSTDEFAGPEVVYETIEDVYKEFDHWILLKQEKEKSLADERRMIEEEAVERYRNEKEKNEQKARDETQKLRSTLAQYGLAPSKIDQIVREASTVPASQFDLGVSGGDGNGESPARASATPMARRRKKKHWFSRSVKSSDPPSTSSDGLPDMLRDATRPGGIAQLRAIYFQRISIAPSRYEIVKLEVAVPDYRLIPKLLSFTAENPGSDTVSSFLQGFAEVPEDYRYHITKELELIQEIDNSNWIILQIEPIMSHPSRLPLSRKHRPQVVGVYVVLRKASDPSTDLFSAPSAVPGEVKLQVPPPEILKPALATSAGAAELNLQPEQAGTYRARKMKTEETEPELIYASNLRHPERPPSPEYQSRRVEFADDRSRYPYTSWPTYINEDPTGLGGPHVSRYPVDRSRPTYIKVSRIYVLPETLDYYGLPWEVDPTDNSYFIIKENISLEATEALFEHTRRIRERRPYAARDVYVSVDEPRRSRTRRAYSADGDDDQYYWADSSKARTRERNRTYLRSPSPIRGRDESKMKFWEAEGAMLPMINRSEKLDYLEKPGIRTRSRDRGYGRKLTIIEPPPVIERKRTYPSGPQSTIRVSGTQRYLPGDPGRSGSRNWTQPKNVSDGEASVSSIDIQDVSLDPGSKARSAEEAVSMYLDKWTNKEAVPATVDDAKGQGSEQPSGPLSRRAMAESFEGSESRRPVRMATRPQVAQVDSDSDTWSIPRNMRPSVSGPANPESPTVADDHPAGAAAAQMQSDVLGEDWPGPEAGERL